MKQWLAVGLICMMVFAARAAELPNIVLILADDLGRGDLGAYNAASKIPTPHMDRIARQGMRFTDAHTPSSVCTPTRYGLLTGRYCWRTRLKNGVLWGRDGMLLEPGRPTLASMLRSKGYATGVVGKWHLGLGSSDEQTFEGPLDRGPADVGFDYSYIIPSSLDIPPYLWIENGVPTGKLTVLDPGSKRVWDGGNGFWREGLRTEDFRFHEVLPRIAQRSVAFIETNAKSGKPFFLYIPFASPHTPWVPNTEFRGKSSAGTYGDFTHETDDAIGRILSAIDGAGIAGNTLVIITSDNGSHWPEKQIREFGHDANEGMRGMKADIWEGGHRVPLLVRWPGKVSADSVSDELIGLTDVYATIAAIVSHELGPAEAEDSFNMLAVWQGKQPADRPVRSSIIHHSLNGTFAIRKGDWKLIPGELGSGGFTPPQKREPKTGEPGGQLYHLATDPLEENNRYDAEVGVVAELSGILQQIQEAGRSRPD